ncbi:hypothetical protein N665_0890s0015 [Sinapis alba]|nr:hypothetical protein N665_0890s0015 [Sinapis alba]
MYNTDKLYYEGVKFKTVGDELLLCVSFENGCLKMSRLTVGDNIEMKLRNIMALEQCHNTLEAYVCNYVIYLEYLIDTDKDVELLFTYACIEWFVVVLCLKGIIHNFLRQPALVAWMVNNLELGIIEFVSNNSDIAVEIKKYYRNPVNRSKAALKHAYFSNMWTGTATIAATILLVMTLIQTWASIN